MFSVAPTLGKSKCICVPSIFSALQIISPYSSFIFIPNFSNPFKCRSIGLEPISQPPGYEKLALLYFPIIAPANITEDLIFLIKFSGISYVFILLVSIIILLFFLVTFPPMSLIISNIVCTSWIFGTLYNVIFPFTNTVAAIIGNAAFLEPDIRTSPANSFPPWIINFDIFSPLFLFTIFYVIQNKDVNYTIVISFFKIFMVKFDTILFSVYNNYVNYHL